MRIPFYTFFVSVCMVVSCSKQEKTIEKFGPIPQNDLKKISSLGFSISGVRAYNDGYIVENDIYIHRDSLNNAPITSSTLRIANSEQYRTINVVKVPRTISISGELIGGKLNVALDTMINRYNKLNLNLKFRRVISDGYIRLYPKYDFTGGVIATSGFPNSFGDPYRNVLINMYLLSAYNMQQWGFILQHEIGHAIGFRHTDYMDRSFSCFGLPSPSNEGQSDVGAILIPGTPSTPNEESFMLSCYDGNPQKTFNSNDIIAMKYLFK